LASALPECKYPVTFKKCFLNAKRITIFKENTREHGCWSVLDREQKNGLCPEAFANMRPKAEPQSSQSGLTRAGELNNSWFMLREFVLILLEPLGP
jgi:hypothetical protein